MKLSGAFTTVWWLSNSAARHGWTRPLATQETLRTGILFRSEVSLISISSRIRRLIIDHIRSKVQGFIEFWLNICVKPQYVKDKLNYVWNKVLSALSQQHINWCVKWRQVYSMQTSILFQKPHISNSNIAKLDLLTFARKLFLYFITYSYFCITSGPLDRVSA